MPRKQMTRRKTRPVPLDKTIMDFLFFGPGVDTPKGSPGYELRMSRFFDRYALVLSTWRRHEAELMAIWLSEPRDGRPWAAVLAERFR